MSQEVYAIIDLDGYISQMRTAAAKSLSPSDEENLDDYISVGQIKNMINNVCLGFDNEDRPLLNEETNEKIFEDTAVWIHNVALAKLAAQDLVECAWDNESNDMIFWTKEKKKESNAKRKPRRNDKKTGG